MPISIYLGDLHDPFDAQATLHILSVYHESIVGNNGPLPEKVRETVIDGLLACGTRSPWKYEKTILRHSNSIANLDLLALKKTPKAKLCCLENWFCSKKLNNVGLKCH